MISCLPLLSHLLVICQVSKDMYKRARKLRRASDAVGPLLEAAQEELEYIEQVGKSIFTTLISTTSIFTTLISRNSLTFSATAQGIVEHDQDSPLKTQYAIIIKYAIVLK